MARSLSSSGSSWKGTNKEEWNGGRWTNGWLFDVCGFIYMFGYFNGRDFEGIYIRRGRVNEDKDLKIQRVESSCPKDHRGQGPQEGERGG